MSMIRRPQVTTRAHDAFARAHDLADRLGHDDVTPAHIALGVLREGRNIGVGALVKRGVPLDILAGDLGVDFVSCEHLLLALLRDEASSPTQVFAAHGIRTDDVRAEIIRFYNVRPE